MIVFIISPVEFNEQPDDVIEVANLDQSQDVDIAGTTRRLTTSGAGRKQRTTDWRALCAVFDTALLAVCVATNTTECVFYPKQVSNLDQIDLRSFYFWFENFADQCVRVQV